ncbi:RluA family pseudouridine synthase [Verrucomicrobiota bacterium sgz303538]
MFTSIQKDTHTSRNTITPRFGIVDEAPDFLVVDKPPFMQAHPSKPSDTRTLWNELRDLLSFEIVNGGQVSIINRLDRETSGLTLVGKTRGAARSFCRQMEMRRIGKEYLAIVWGWPAEDEWTVEAPLLREGEIREARIYLKQAVHPTGVPAVTRFRVERRLRISTSNGNEFSVVRAFPETGRMHQIRVHLAYSGHSIVGDKIYGPDEGCYLEFISTGWTSELAYRLLLPRHALHSAVLKLEESGKEWRAPLAGDLEEFLRDR